MRIVYVVSKGGDPDSSSSLPQYMFRKGVADVTRNGPVFCVEVYVKNWNILYFITN